MTLLWSAALFATLLGSPVAAPAPDLPTSFDLTAVDAYIAGQVKTKGYVGLSVAVMRDGKIVFAKGYGRRSIEKNLPDVGLLRFEDLETGAWDEVDTSSARVRAHFEATMPPHWKA